MKTFIAILVLLLGAAARPVSAQEPASNAPRFLVMDVFADAGTSALAAYQIEVKATNGLVKIVGIEGGEPVAFRSPPYYDPAAMQTERVVLGAFSLATPEQLPRGQVRIASLHCQASGLVQPGFIVNVTTAATHGGQPIPIRVTVQERSQK